MPAGQGQLHPGGHSCVMQAIEQLYRCVCPAHICVLLYTCQLVKANSIQVRSRLRCKAASLQKDRCAH